VHHPLVLNPAVQVSRGGDGYASVRHVSSLTAHLSTVNCVRFSPTGAAASRAPVAVGSHACLPGGLLRGRSGAGASYPLTTRLLLTHAGNHLVSSGDGGEVLVWEPQEGGSGGGAPPRRALGDKAEGEALWRRCAALKGHGAQSDVMDVCWAPDGTALASAAIDNEVILFGWGAKRRGEHAGRFKNHKHFVQGVAWDPAQQFLVTQSADRTCRCVRGGGGGGPPTGGGGVVGRKGDPGGG
jgi:chromatin assembly factor 1 subunit B